MQIKDIRHKKPSGLPLFFIRLLNIKLFRESQLFQKGILVISREGYREFLLRLWSYLKKNRLTIIPGIKTDYDRWIEENRLSEKRIEEIENEIHGFQYKPKISVIMPVYNVNQIWLEKTIDSVINQIYENWELCITDDGSTKEHIRETLDRYTKKEKRIKAKYLEDNKGISAASNVALRMATGEYVSLLDNDDEFQKRT